MNHHMIAQELQKEQPDFEKVKVACLDLLFRGFGSLSNHLTTLCLYIEATRLCGENQLAYHFGHIARDLAKERRQPLYEARALRLLILTESHPARVNDHLNDMAQLAGEAPLELRPEIYMMFKELQAEFSGDPSSVRS